MIGTGRAVEVLHDRGPVTSLNVNRWISGSGYLIGGRLVLTAAHTVDHRGDLGDDEQLLVRTIEGIEFAALVVLASDESSGVDLALLEVIDPRFEEHLPPVTFARVNRDSPVPVSDCWAVGFPQFGEAGPVLAEGGRRETWHVRGDILPGGKLRSGLLSLQVASTPQALSTPLGRSEWEGMSGAVVFASDSPDNDRVVGVISTHHRPEGESALTVMPVTAIGRLPAPGQWWHRLGVPDQGALSVLPRQTASAAGGVPRLAEDALSFRQVYLEQVRRIAPPDPPGLVGREEELAELARFCLQPDARPYAYWQADAWAGKSALLSTFVLSPSAEVAARARIVSFFITARLAAQDTREAFIQVALEQLAGLLGQSLPTALPEATREAFVLNLMSRAAAACAEVGRRLILLVDGLDEDRGTTTGPDAHSIAGLLPANPPAGMRVIVAGRPNPPIPDDVPDWHPLRDPKIIRLLAPSPYAGGIRRLSSQELKRLLRGSAAVQDLLGLLTVARGGLSAPDLEELTDLPRWDIEEILHTATGRTFARRASRWTPGTLPETYLLGHEELQATATAYLGEGRLVGYRNRLHAWADAWRSRGWPPGTPEYLLGGYYRLLEDVGDLPRMIEFAGDMARHDRMLDVTGGDAAAVAEIRTVLDRIAVQDAPDLANALVLACHRDQLIRRNAFIPAGLPGVWASLGQLRRAEGLAASIADPRMRARALADVAAALAKDGQLQQGASVARQAETAAKSITDLYQQELALVGVAAALAGAGQPEQAIAAARSITIPYWQELAVAGVAAALAGAGLPEEAIAAARSITEPSTQARALTDIAAALAESGQPEQGASVAGQAETAARSITDPDMQTHALADVAAALAGAGLPEQAIAVAQSITEPSTQAHALAGVAAALAKDGHYQQAITAARSITDPARQARALADVAAALAEDGQPEQGASVAGQAETAARSITDPDTQAHVLADVAAALAKDGHPARRLSFPRQRTNPRQALANEAVALAGIRQYEQAIAVARSITDPDMQARALADVAAALAKDGQPEQAASVAGQAETAARSITDPDTQAHVLADVAAALAEDGQPEQAASVAGQAETAARSITDPDTQARALTDVAEALAGARLYEQAITAAQSITDPAFRTHSVARVAAALAKDGQPEQAIAVARSITNPNAQASALAGVAAALAKYGEPEQAVAVARSISSPGMQARALADVAAALAEDGQLEQAAPIAGQAETAARSITHPGTHAWALARVAAAFAGAGQLEQAASVAGQAETAARSITDPDRQAHALADVAAALAAGGRPEQGIAVARSITAPGTRAQAQADVAAALAAGGRPEQAVAVARSITNPDRQARALADVAAALAAGGRLEQAAAVARSITAPGTRAQAQATIAVALARTGRIESGKRLAADVCASGKWTIAVRPVLLLTPSAYTRVMDILKAW